MRDHDGVEFIDAEPDEGPDEELAQPAGFPRLRRARLPLLVAGGVALIAIVAVDVAHSPKSTPAAGPATVTATPHASPSSSSATPSPSGRRLVIRMQPNGKVALSDHDLSCAGSTSCEVLLDTPHAVRDAVQHDLPHIQHLRTVTVARAAKSGSVLSVRRITGRTGPAHLSISIRPAASGDQLGWNAVETASQTLATVDVHIGSRLVALRLTAPPGLRLDIAAVRRLAADPRLVTLG